MFFSRKKPEGKGAEETARLAEVIAYHEATKHHFHRYARSLGYLDWDNQPNPFRIFEGCARIKLPFSHQDEFPTIKDLLGGVQVRPQKLNLESIGFFFEHSMALSAWKEFQGSRWALRVNPSSGNLHPTEGYVVLPPGLSSLDEGLVCHYAPQDHHLEIRARISESTWTQVFPEFPREGFLAGLSSIHWREAWKYGERAYRYCQQDVGHALAALSFSAAMLGWDLILLEAPSDEDLAALFGLDRNGDFLPEEREHPDLVALVVPQGSQYQSQDINFSVLPEISKSFEWSGKANRLSNEHVPWERIDAVAMAARKPSTSTGTPPGEETIVPNQESIFHTEFPQGNLSARQIILQRRSAVAFDGKTGLPRDVFYSILAQTLPYRTNQSTPPPPWTSVPGFDHVHLCLFVHLIEESPRDYIALFENLREKLCCVKP